MRERTKAYMAGIMDGEGCLTVGRDSSGDCINYSAQLILVNKSRRLMKWVVKNFGGGFIEYPNRSGSILRWTVSSRSHGLKVLDMLEPYWIIKREQAGILRQYYELGDAKDPGLRESLYIRMRAAKQNCVTTNTPDTFSRKTIRPYLAGFFDAEGNVDVSTCHRQLQPKVRLTNMVAAPLEICRGTFGGEIYPGYGGKKTMDWILYLKSKLELFALAMLPYLIIKREQMKALLSFVRLDGEHRQERLGIQSFLRQAKIESQLHGDMQRAFAVTQMPSRQ